MDNTLELGDTVQGSMMLEQAGLSRFEQNMVLTHTRGQRTMTAIAEALLEQHYDVHRRGRETPVLTGSSSSSNRWRRRDTVRAYLAEAEPIKEPTDSAVYGKEDMPDDYDGEQDEPEDDEVQDTDLLNVTCPFPKIQDYSHALEEWFGDQERSTAQNNCHLLTDTRVSQCPWE